VFFHWRIGWFVKVRNASAKLKLFFQMFLHWRIGCFVKIRNASVKLKPTFKYFYNEEFLIKMKSFIQLFLRLYYRSYQSVWKFIEEVCSFWILLVTKVFLSCSNCSIFHIKANCALLSFYLGLLEISVEIRLKSLLWILYRFKCCDVL